MSSEKVELREQLLLHMSSLKQDEIEAASKEVATKIAQLLRELNVDPQRVLTYTPLPGEIRPNYSEDVVISLFPTVRLSRVLPTRTERMPIGSYDLILLPTVGFTKDCYRLGRGGGWYDRFLITQPNASLIGLGYDWAECNFIVEAHDQQLNYIVTSRGGQEG